jgi:hypothetical protein
MISFGDGGTTACVDATISGGFSPSVAHLHAGETGANGGVTIDITPFLVAPGRYFGCGSIDAMDTINILANPSNFYFNFHEGGPDGDGDEDFKMTVRGQLSD